MDIGSEVNWQNLRVGHEYYVGRNKQRINDIRPKNPGITCIHTDTDEVLIVGPDCHDHTFYSVIHDCSICMDDIDPKKTGRVDLHCGHLFHLKCITKWLSANESCPMCRAKPCEDERLLECEEPSEWTRFIAHGYTNLYEHVIRPITVDESQLGEMPASYSWPNEDIRLVAIQSGVNLVRALDALNRLNGDIVNAIMDLTSNS